MFDNRPRSEKYPLETVMPVGFVPLILLVLSFISVRGDHSIHNYLTALLVFISSLSLFEICRLYKTNIDPSLLGSVVFISLSTLFFDVSFVSFAWVTSVLLQLFSLTKIKKVGPSLSAYSILFFSSCLVFLGVYPDHSVSYLVVLALYILVLFKDRLSTSNFSWILGIVGLPLLVSVLPLALNFQLYFGLPLGDYLSKSSEFIYLGFAVSFLILLSFAFLVVAPNYRKNRFALFWSFVFVWSSVRAFNLFEMADLFNLDSANNRLVEFVPALFVVLSASFLCSIVFYTFRSKIAKKRAITAAKALLLALVLAVVVYSSYLQPELANYLDKEMLRRTQEFFIVCIVFLSMYFLSLSGERKSTITFVLCFFIFGDSHTLKGVDWNPETTKTPGVRNQAEK